MRRTQALCLARSPPYDFRSRSDDLAGARIPPRPQHPSASTARASGSPTTRGLRRKMAKHRFTRVFDILSVHLASSGTAPPAHRPLQGTRGVFRPWPAGMHYWYIGTALARCMLVPMDGRCKRWFESTMMALLPAPAMRGLDGSAWSLPGWRVL